MGEIEKVRSVYNVLCDEILGDDNESVKKRELLIEYLEKTIKTTFKNTADMHKRVSAFLGGGGDSQRRLIKARKKKHWGQAILAIHLGISKSMVQHMESGRKPLIEKALQFIEKVEGATSESN